jgi:hypothetical protein
MVNDPKEDKVNDAQGIFYEELELIFDKFHEQNLTILCELSAEVGKEDLFKPTNGIENLHEIKNNDAVRIVSTAKSKTLIVNSILFPHRNIR